MAERRTSQTSWKSHNRWLELKRLSNWIHGPLWWEMQRVNYFCCFDYYINYRVASDLMGANWGCLWKHLRVHRRKRPTLFRAGVLKTFFQHNPVLWGIFFGDPISGMVVLFVCDNNGAVKPRLFKRQDYIGYKVNAKTTQYKFDSAMVQNDDPWFMYLYHLLIFK